MSDNKFKFFRVTTETMVRANNKTDAVKLTQKKRGVEGGVLTESVQVDRVSAISAHLATNIS